MKIITGISNAHKPEEIEAYAEAGVDEFFIGYVPQVWKEVYGFEISCNRREHSRYQYQDQDNLENVVQLIHQAGRKVFLTLNAHEYNLQQYELVLKILKSIQHIPFDGFILSNLALMLELRNAGIDKAFNISIGAGNSTPQSLKFYQENVSNIQRFILPRKFTLSELKELTDYGKEQSIKLEAFLLGDPCHFSDEYCFTWHGAANESLCNSPMYKHKAFNPIIFKEDWKEAIIRDPLSSFYERHAAIVQKTELQRTKQMGSKNAVRTANEVARLNILARVSKCGLCAVQKFKDWGVDAVKLPLRGYNIETNLMVISLVKKVIETKNATPDFCRKLLSAPSFCSGKNCYYDYPYPK